MLSTCGDSCKTVRTGICDLYSGTVEVDHPERQGSGRGLGLKERKPTRHLIRTYIGDLSSAGGEHDTNMGGGMPY